ncbi:haloacid dehalogenase-like hydrolase [Schizosaccharomyces japonicus yFS275]|uniref:Haloacid dehalogenase-like hydrolase n=1 Tax=Schizosaccharomyces japonicus (strain yFS275 / FY16936) TaxID=402676 RepID=B6K8F0_SCHJY|nr:haloacid dehalogenase-like hydrolase [Schizosaccharomyces japonicus yFS275]EEB09804.2 haloacid dehalogenase-like hydrolase [Schizosaccharomyces japonicus yFS275]
MSEKRSYRACLFDMDGLLIDSEEVYTETTNQILARYGKGPLILPVKVQMMGRPGHEAARVVIEWSGIPMTPQQFVDEQQVIRAKYWKNVKLMPGVESLITNLENRNIPIGLATSSNTENFRMKTEYLQHLFRCFGSRIITGDDKRIPEGRGKPYPDIWLQTLNLINEQLQANGLEPVKPEECLAFEDSIPGVKSAKAAGMHVIWVPAEAVLRFAKDEIPELLDEQCEILNSLEAFEFGKYFQS